MDFWREVSVVLLQKMFVYLILIQIFVQLSLDVFIRSEIFLHDFDVFHIYI